MSGCQRKGAVPKAASKSAKQHTECIGDLNTNTLSKLVTTRRQMSWTEIQLTQATRNYWKQHNKLFEIVKNSVRRWQKANRTVVKGSPVRKTKLCGYLKGKTGYFLRREEPFETILSNAIEGRDYLHNGVRNTKFGYGCRTGASRSATGETCGASSWCVCVYVTVWPPASSYPHHLEKSVLGGFMGMSLGHGLLCWFMWLVVPLCVAASVCMYLQLCNTCRPGQRMDLQMRTAANRLRGEIIWAGKLP